MSGTARVAAVWPGFPCKRPGYRSCLSNERTGYSAPLMSRRSFPSAPERLVLFTFGVADQIGMKSGFGFGALFGGVAPGHDGRAQPGG